VKFSIGHADADELIEQLIRRDSTPRRLTVVSSDHRLQRAAKRRKAHAIDSDKWFSAVLRSRIDKRRLAPPATKPAPLDEHQVRFWLRQFGVEDGGQVDEQADKSPPGAGRHGSEPPPRDSPTDSTSMPGGPYNPFPPGYGEDISEDDF